MMSKTHRILVIQGGGSRGIIPLLILNLLNDILKKQTGKDIRDISNLAAGTSVGAICLAGLFLRDEDNISYKYPIEDIINLFQRINFSIFKKNKLSKVINRNLKFTKDAGYFVDNLVGSRFDIEKMKSQLAEIFGDAKFEDLKIPCIFISYNTDFNSLVLFGSKQPSSSFTEALKKYLGASGTFELENPFLVDALCSSSAAPFYFNSYKIRFNNKVLQFIDGGVISNNPCVYGLIEFLKMKNSPYRTGDKIKILSIGTGNFNKDRLFEVSNYSKIFNINKFIEILLKNVDIVNNHIHNIFDNNSRNLEIDEINVDISEKDITSNDLAIYDERSFNKMIVNVKKNLDTKQLNWKLFNFMED